MEGLFSFPASLHPLSARSAGAGGESADASGAPTAFATASALFWSTSASNATLSWSLHLKSIALPGFSKRPDLWCTPWMESAHERVFAVSPKRLKPNVSGLCAPARTMASILSLEAVPSVLRSATPVPQTDLARASRTSALRRGDIVRASVSLRRAKRSRLCRRIASSSALGTRTGCESPFDTACFPGLNLAGGSPATEGGDSANARASASPCARDVSSNPGDMAGGLCTIVSAASRDAETVCAQDRRRK